MLILQLSSWDVQAKSSPQNTAKSSPQPASSVRDPNSSTGKWLLDSGEGRGGEGDGVGVEGEAICLMSYK